MSADSRAMAGEAGLLSVVIKTYNEQDKLARAIESALAVAPEIAPLRLEVVVADSRSTDDTVAVARRYPVRLVALRHPQDRGCGTGAQLGFAWSRGEWVYLMDGDMQLAPGFLAEALACLAADPALAGVGGVVQDTRIANGFDRIRVNNRSGGGAGQRRWLEGGGLYRRAAIVQAGGHAADRNLQAYEEAELGLRLGAAGFCLLRLPRVAVQHEGHALGTWALMRRHWRSRRAMSAGVLLRMAWRQPWRGQVLRLLAHPLATGAWWLLLLAGLLWPGVPAGRWLALWAALSALAVGALALRKRDALHALVSVASWHHGLAALLVGLFGPLRPASEPIAADLLREASDPGAPPLRP